MQAISGVNRLSALDRSRTYDLRFRKPTLYPLSYEGVLTEAICNPSIVRLTTLSGATKGESSCQGYVQIRLVRVV